MIHEIMTLLSHNALIGGGAALGLFQTLKTYPDKIIAFLKRRLFTVIDIQKDSGTYKYVENWLSKHEYTKKSRYLSASHKWTIDEEGEYSHKLFFTPAPGEHFMFYKKHLLWVHRSREERKGVSMSGAGNFIESFTLTFVGRNKYIGRELLMEVQNQYEAENAKTELTDIYVNRDSHWYFFTGIKPRAWDSIILNEQTKANILHDLESFRDDKNWYKQLGIPYRRGYLLYGPPGSGKTSLIQALAGKLGLAVYILNLNSNMSDESLNALLMDVPPKSAIVIEDVDALFEKRQSKVKEKKEETTDGIKDVVSDKISFSGLLNSLDGITSKDGQIIFMTTNHIEKLDPALIRPGRIDYRLLLDNADENQAKELFLRIYPKVSTDKAAKFGVLAKGRSMASLQNHLVIHKYNAEQAVENMSLLK